MQKGRSGSQEELFKEMGVDWGSNVLRIFFFWGGGGVHLVNEKVLGG